MEGFLESFLYLLVTIIILVLSMRKKKPVGHMEESQETGTNDPFRDIFKQREEEEYETEEGKAAEYHQEDIEKEYRERHEKKVQWLTESDAKQSRLDMDRIMKEASDNNPIASVGIEESEIYGADLTEDTGIRINLKKAVIHSIILERKTF
jgi:hypothetical protein